jgi:hypothetical protein
MPKGFVSTYRVVIGLNWQVDRVESQALKYNPFTLKTPKSRARTIRTIPAAKNAITAGSVKYKINAV